MKKKGRRQVWHRGISYVMAAIMILSGAQIGSLCVDQTPMTVRAQENDAALTTGDPQDSGNPEQTGEKQTETLAQETGIPSAYLAGASDCGELTVTNIKITVNGRDLAGTEADAPEYKVDTDDSGNIVYEDYFTVSMNWTIGNDVVNQDKQKFVWEPSPLENIRLLDVPRRPLKQTGMDDPIGEYWIENNKVYIELNGIGMGLSERSGWFSIMGGLAPRADGEPYKKDDKIHIRLDSCEGYIRYSCDTVNNKLELFKYAVGNIFRDGNDYYQKFQVSMTVQPEAGGGSAGSIVFPANAIKDTPGANLGIMTNIQITQTGNIPDFDWGNPDSMRFASLDALNRALQGKSMSGTLAFVYDMKVDNPDGVTASPDPKYQNTAAADYVNGAGESVKTGEASAYPRYEAPTIEKSDGTPVNDKGETDTENPTRIRWTIRIRLNSAWDGKDALSVGADQVIRELKDQLTVSGRAQAETDLAGSSFTHVGDGVFEYVYYTDAPDTAASPVPVRITNAVKMRTDKGAEKTASGSVTLQPGSAKLLLGKTFEGISGKNLTWKIELGKIPDGLTELTLGEDTGGSWDKTGRHGISSGAKIGIQLDGGSKVEITPSESGGAAAPSGAAGVIADCVKGYDGNHYTIRFNLDKVKGHTVTVYVTTDIADSDTSGKTYLNKVTLNYKVGTDAFSENKEAEWKETSALKKTGQLNGSEAAYRVMVDVSAIDGLTVGDVITLTDTLPEGTKYVTGSMAVVTTAAADGNDWYPAPTAYEGFDPASGLSVSPADPAGGQQKLTVKFTVTDALQKAAAANRSGKPSGKPYVRLEYKAEMTSLSAFYQSDGSELRSYLFNKVEGTVKRAGGSDELSIGKASSEIPVYQNSLPRLISKTADQPRGSEIDGDPNYTVYINESGLRLLEGDSSLTVTDTLGTALSYDETSVKVFKKDGDGQYTVNVENKGSGVESWRVGTVSGKQTLTFTLADETAYKITYTAMIDLSKILDPKHSISAEEGSNQIVIDGISGSSGSASAPIEGRVLWSSAGAVAQNGRVYIRKFYRDGSAEKLLFGSEFGLDLMNQDLTGVQTEFTRKICQADMDVEDKNKRYCIDGLTYDNVYRLTEIKADEGFELRTEPYYFYIRSQGLTNRGYSASFEVINADHPTLDDPGKTPIYELQRGTGSTLDGWVLDYENVPEEDTGRLVIEKTIPGDVTQEEAEGALRFKVTCTLDGTVQFANTYSLSSFEYDAAHRKWTKTLPRREGIYMVEETVADIDGYELQSVKYSLTGTEEGFAGITDQTVTGNPRTKDFHIAENTVVTASFTDEYTKKAQIGKLILTKTISGLVTREEAEGALKFTVRDTAAGNANVYTLQKDFTYDPAAKKWTKKLNVPAGAYEITETVTDISGYELKKVSYTLSRDGTTVDKDQPLTGTAVKKTTQYTMSGAEVAENKTTQVDFYNDYRTSVGSLKITKTIEGEVTPEEVAGGLIFTVVSEDGSYQKKYLIKGNANPGDDFTREGSSDGTRVYVKELQNLKPGRYTVTETVDFTRLDSALQEKYKNYEVTASYAINKTASVNGKSAVVTVEGGRQQTIAYKNIYEKLTASENGTLVITKTIRGEVTREEAEGALRFTVKDTRNPDAARTYTLRDFDYDPITKKWTRSLPRPEGQYMVTEEVVSGTLQDYVLQSVGYALTVPKTGAAGETETSYGSGKSATLNVTENETTTLDYTNQYATKRGVIEITKTVEGPLTPEEIEGALRFRVTSAGNGYDKTFKIRPDFKLKSDTSNEDGSRELVYVLSLSVKPGSYQIEEITDDPAGCVRRTSYTITNNADGGKTETGSGRKASVEVSADFTTQAAYKNVYQKLDTAAGIGKLCITKTIEGDVTEEEAEGALQFTVTDTGSKTSETYSLKEFDHVAGTKLWTLTLPQPVGRYEIQESVYAIDGYTLVSQSYALDDNETVDITKTPDKAAAASVRQNKITTVAYRDEYEAQTGTLRITKTITGELTPEEIEGVLKFTVVGVSGGKTVYNGTFTLKHDFTPENGIYVKELPKLQEGEYTVSENLVTQEGYLMKTTYKIDGSGGQEGRQASVTVEAGETTALDYENAYYQIVGNSVPILTLSKTVEGAESGKAADSIEFRLEYNGTTQIIALNDFEKHTVNTNIWEQKYPILAESCVVTETKRDIAGHVLKKVTYTVTASGKNNSGSSYATGEIALTDYTADVAFKDVYEKRNTGKSKSKDDSDDDDPEEDGAENGGALIAVSTAAALDTPQTGDERYTPMMWAFAVMLLSGIGLAATFIIMMIQKRKRKSGRMYR